MKSFQFWFRVWTFPVLSFIFSLAITFSLAIYETDHYELTGIRFPIQFSASLLGYVYFLLTLGLQLGCQRQRPEDKTLKRGKNDEILKLKA